VLIVDDLPRWADAVQRYSQVLPCDTRHTSSLTAAVQSLDAWRPQLILLDLHMPRDDWQPEPTLYQKYGADQKTLAFCEQITSDPAYQNIMVVITSVEEQYEEQKNALRAGAFRFYTKEDFRLEDLEELLQILQARLTEFPL
jgi:CheY-like chemotaxis protein